MLRSSTLTFFLFAKSEATHLINLYLLHGYVANLGLVMSERSETATHFQNICSPCQSSPRPALAAFLSVRSHRSSLSRRAARDLPAGVLVAKDESLLWSRIFAACRNRALVGRVQDERGVRLDLEALYVPKDAEECLLLLHQRIRARFHRPDHLADR